MFNNYKIGGANLRVRLNDKNPTKKANGFEAESTFSRKTPANGFAAESTFSRKSPANGISKSESFKSSESGEDGWSTIKQAKANINDDFQNKPKASNSSTILSNNIPVKNYPNENITPKTSLSTHSNLSQDSTLRSNFVEFLTILSKY